MKLPKIKQTEKKVKKAIKDYLEYNGWKVYPINNAGQYRGKNKDGKDRYSFAGEAGVPDLYCLKRGESALWIETKATGKKPSPEQIEFIQLANSLKICGTKAIWADSFDRFLQLYNDIKMSKVICPH